jgi:hypothetical protein
MNAGTKILLSLLVLVIGFGIAIILSISEILQQEHAVSLGATIILVGLGSIWASKKSK